MNTQRQALETLRVRLGLPFGGYWNYDPGKDRWVYQYATGPETFVMTAGVCPPEPTTHPPVNSE